MDLIKKIGMIVVGCYLSACSVVHNRTYNVHADAEPFVQSFSELSGFPINDLDIRIQPFNKGSSIGTIIGYCFKGTGKKVKGLTTEITSTPKIVIQESWWYDERTTNAEREALIFHELGHCLLGKKHYDGQIFLNEDNVIEKTPELPGTNVSNKSIMNTFHIISPSDSKNQYNNYISYRERDINEYSNPRTYKQLILDLMGNQLYNKDLVNQEIFYSNSNYVHLRNGMIEDEVYAFNLASQKTSASTIPHDNTPLPIPADLHDCEGHYEHEQTLDEDGNVISESFEIRGL